jgi:hypothetical protein
MAVVQIKCISTWCVNHSLNHTALKVGLGMGENSGWLGCLTAGIFRSIRIILSMQQGVPKIFNRKKNCEQGYLLTIMIRSWQNNGVLYQIKISLSPEPGVWFGMVAGLGCAKQSVLS